VASVAVPLRSWREKIFSQRRQRFAAGATVYNSVMIDEYLKLVIYNFPKRYQVMKKEVKNAAGTAHQLPRPMLRFSSDSNDFQKNNQ
jgi:hypothetical protein